MTAPRSLRWALVTAVVLGVQVSFASLNELYLTVNLDEPPAINDNFAGTQAGLSAESQRRVWLAGVSAERSALRGQQALRVAVLAGLALASALVAVQTFRLRFSPPALKHATLLAQLTTAAAVVRTLDGAQNLRITRVMAEAVARALLDEGMRDGELAGGMLLAMFTAGSLLRSLVVVGLFVGLSAYYRSDTVRAYLQKA